MAIFHAVEARSEEWLALRLGRLGSSEFHRVVTPGKLQISSQSKAVMYRLIAERITGAQVENADVRTEWMDRGIDLEDRAYRAYEALTDTETSVGGIFLADDGVLCCSPDRLVGDAGDLELKAPLIHTQVGYALDGLDDAYKLQLQGRMLIHGREWVDLFSYHPLLVLPPLRVHRDEKVIAVLRGVLASFSELLIKNLEDLTQRYGPFTRPAETEQADSPDFLSEGDVEEHLVELRKAGA